MKCHVFPPSLLYCLMTLPWKRPLRILILPLARSFVFHFLTCAAASFGGVFVGASSFAAVVVGASSFGAVVVGASSFAAVVGEGAAVVAGASSVVGVTGHAAGTLDEHMDASTPPDFSVHLLVLLYDFVSD